MNIPTIGGARGIFEYFVPGIFLLLNLGVATYLFPFTDPETRNGLLAAASDPGVTLVVGVSFGYLIGVLLRLFQTDLPDRLSAFWMRRVRRLEARQADGKYKLWAVEHFPYFGWIEQICRLYLPAEALDFYEKTWGRRTQGQQNKQFFTFIKTMINSVDPRAAEEMYAAESLSRYIAGMFYALSFACFALLITILAVLTVTGQLLTGLVILFGLYLLAITGILAHYRFIRIKEVEIVFAASFKNRALFEEPSPKTKTERRAPRRSNSEGKRTTA